MVVLKNHITIFSESFGLILQNLNLICVIGTVESYLGFWGERLNFGITIAEIQPKVWDRRRKRWREKMLNFGNMDTEIPLPNSAARVWGVCGVPKVKRKKKNFDKLIVAMPLPKQGGKNCNNCGNGIAENGGKKMWFRNLERVKKKCYVHNIFTINHMWLVIISSNLNLTLRLFF